VGNFFFCDKGLASLLADMSEANASNYNGLQNDLKVTCEELGRRLWITRTALHDG